MPDPLLFVCNSSPVRSGARLARASLATIETPSGPAFMAFGSQELAGAVVALLGTAEGVFLLPETRLVPELVPSPTRHPVLVFRTYDDYDGAMRNAPDFPWAERIIDYDFAAAVQSQGDLADDKETPV